ncbi:hypothetical protein [Chengkuizengella axinellae]|uniref:DUF4358 domain-containing protein n=1 Tax=Chengkuizengella axinellae TaxID=3064388 RepID=A0ABT9IWV6_9BACL|nr:hypothetical protein [Chengkuizengella sp. 2205SS18-9]MDP5273850.1 hypothetical protein [Chengkuizengella sp. 2205SS18-9]
MKKMKVILYMLVFLLVLVLTSCATNNNKILTIDDVTTAITDEGIEMKEIERNPRNIFQLDLNGVAPNVYTIQDNELTIYVFENETERQKGMDEFKERLGSATIDTDKFTYEINNVVLFYVYTADTIDEKMESVINKLSS